MAEEQTKDNSEPETMDELNNAMNKRIAWVLFRLLEKGNLNALEPLRSALMKTAQERPTDPLELCRYLGESNMITNEVLRLLGGAWPEGGEELFKRSRQERKVWAQHQELALAKLGGAIEGWMTSS